jgi:hypothetical protein
MHSPNPLRLLTRQIDKAAVYHETGSIKPLLHLVLRRAFHPTNDRELKGDNFLDLTQARSE